MAVFERLVKDHLNGGSKRCRPEHQSTQYPTEFMS